LISATFGGSNSQGEVHTYVRIGSSWQPDGMLNPSALSEWNWFGYTVAMSGATVMVGAAGQGLVPPFYSGAVHVFSVPSATDDTPPDVTAVTANDVVYPANPVVTATATDATSEIKSADYSLDGGAWKAMTATDGAFDEKSEGLTGTIDGPLSIDTYEVCIRATDAADNASDGADCDTFSVTTAAMTVSFDGEYLDLNGSPTTLKATVRGPDACKAGAMVEFHLNGSSTPLGSAAANASGVAQYPTTLSSGVYVVRVEVLARDFDEDETAECGGDDDLGLAVVSNDPNAASTGGGWHFVDLGPGDKHKINFGYTAQRKLDRKTGEWITSGNVLWLSNNAYKLKGTINEGGKLPTCPSEFAACAAFGGTGVLYEHNPDYNAEACALGETYRCAEWVNSQPVTFGFMAYDGGANRICTTNSRGKTTCKESLKPDAFGMQFDIVSRAEESGPRPLNGGNVVGK
jgi:hypothetical protein